VRSYATQADGAAATVATLKGPLYFAIVAALATGEPFAVADSQTVAAQITTWGTPNFAAWYLTQIGGGESGASAPPFQPANVPATTTHQVEQAWTRLMRELSIHAPQHLLNVQKARSRIRAAVR
jgi:hypothetical protein